jgi:hypothetical protein
MHEERTDPVNWSTLKNMRVSPKHYLHGLAAPKEQTDAMLLGSLVHCMVLESTEVAKRYRLAPNLHRGMNDDTAVAKGYDGGKQAAAAFDAEVSGCGATIVAPAIWDTAEAMAQAVADDPNAARYLSGGVAEQRLTWTDPVTGIKCRGTVDYIGASRIVEFKTTRSIESFERDAARMGYHGQVAWYDSGVTLAGCHNPYPPIVVVVESAPPFDVMVLDFPDDTYNAGCNLFRDLLDKLHECRTNDTWPGVGGGVVREFRLPEWAKSSDPITPITIGGVAAF